jgi:hypothetical protein
VVAEAVYLLCALTSAACACLLFRAYLANRTPLSFWSSVAFLGLTLNNVLLFVDLVMVPTSDLTELRHGIALAAMFLLNWALVWDAE